MTSHDASHDMTRSADPTLPLFLLFAGFTYYPQAGSSDFQSAHFDLDDAKSAMEKLGDRFDWFEIAQVTPEGLVRVFRLRS